MSPGGKLPPRLAAVVLPVGLLGFGVAVAAAFSFAVSPRDLATLAGIAGLLAASTLAERYPVPLDGIDTGGVSLGFVFCTAAIVLYGWQAGVVVGMAAPIMHLLEHRPPIRVTYNAAVMSIAAAVSGAAIAPLRGDEAGLVFAQVIVAAFAFYTVNLLLISLVVGVSAHKPFKTVTRTSIEVTSMPFALMASAALMLVILWQRSPFLSAALVGPLLAIALYQRSTFRELRAMRLALTDPLTGLGNHRHFHDRLERELADSQAQGYPLSLCLVDIDDFKKINDRFGHPGGDKVLAQLATNLRQGGEAFRLGGDEFAILLPGRDEEGARIAAEAIIERISSVDLAPAGPVTVSAGIATAPLDDVGRDELVRRSDSALYWAKEYGKNQTRVYRPDVVEIAELKRLAAGPDRAARFRAAASLAKAVDARDAYTGSHSERVSDLAARIATRLGVDREQIELTRLAASLHDLGKLAIPEEILRKPGSALRDRAARARASPADRLPDAREPRRRPRRRLGPAPPRALGRHRLSRRSRRRGDPARGPDHLRRRCLRRDDVGPRLPGTAHRRRGDRRAGPLLGQPVRPRRGGGTRRRARHRSRLAGLADPGVRTRVAPAALRSESPTDADAKQHPDRPEPVPPGDLLALRRRSGRNTRSAARRSAACACRPCP